MYGIFIVRSLENGQLVTVATCLLLWYYLSQGWSYIFSSVCESVRFVKSAGIPYDDSDNAGDVSFLC